MGDLTTTKVKAKATTVAARTMVFGCGNPSRGDDALGPLLLERAEQLCRKEALPVDLLLDFQLQVEDSWEMVGRGLCLFVDASLTAGAPFSFQRVLAAADRSITTHALSPAAVLDVYRRTRDEAPPPSFVLAVRGHDFELGHALSPQGQGNLESAWGFLEKLLRRPSLLAWEAAAQGPAG